MPYRTLEIKDLHVFISTLAGEQKVFAPVAKGYNHYVFESVTDAARIALKYIPTILPPKKIFMPQRETILEYNVSEGQNMQAVVEVEKAIIFGVHTCDLAGIQSLNMVFSDRPKDINYLIRKNKIVIIGLECNDYCDGYASCRLVHNHTPNGGYDLFFTDLENGKLMIHISTLLGEKIIEKIKLCRETVDGDLRDLEKIRAKKREIFARNEVPVEHERLPELFEKSYGSKVWEEVGRRCLACGNCTNVCPTCYCFDVVDEPNLDLKTGRRFRRWDSCQLESFSQVAGGENFRKERSARQRHRLYRKFKYPITEYKYSRFFCTGCGRCSRTCMAKINLKETLTALVKEQKMENAQAGLMSPLAEKPAKV